MCNFGIEVLQQIGTTWKVSKNQLRRCGGVVVSVPATRPRFESRPGASPQSGLRGGRSHCNTVHTVNKKLKYIYIYQSTRYADVLILIFKKNRICRKFAHVLAHTIFFCLQN